MKMSCLVALILLCVAGPAAAKNLITDPDFQQSDPAFLTGYIKTTDNSVDEGQYAIGSDPSKFNSNWSSTIQPHTGNSMMIVNGATDPDAIVWDSGPIRVKPHTVYFFGAYVASLFADSPPRLVFRINGAQTGRDFHPSLPVGRWAQFNTAWNSGSATHVSISIVDENTESYGNDFALDDLSLADSPVFMSGPHVITMQIPSIPTLQSEIVTFRCVSDYIHRASP